MRLPVPSVALMGFLAACGAEAANEPDLDGAPNALLDEQLGAINEMISSEALQFRSVGNADVVREVIFEGRGDQPFAQTAGQCLGYHFFATSSELVTATMPSQNSAIYADRASDWTDQDAIDCFQDTSHEDFVVIRAPNFMGIGGEAIMPEGD